MPTPTPSLIWSSALPSDPLTLYNTHNSNRLMTYSMSTDLQTRRLVWCLNNGSADHPIGSPAFAIVGQNAEIFQDEAIAALPKFWDDED